ncbi:lipopolysaccharide biosynthesis protein [Photobacterium nomapromontoriensis]|uniref:lipopolysaccharide biosynthesis protein n=1 Tax=Photobacterium nomapromontoriensis TaxID=2910237 RepID=UPI003D125FFF
MNNKKMLFFGFAGSQCITLLALPILTRLYDPLLFGEYNYFITIVTTVAFFFCFRLNLKIQIVNKEAIKNKIVLKSYMLLALTTILATSIYCYFSGFTIGLIYFMIVIVFLSLYEIHTDYYSSNKSYKKIAIANILRATTVILFQIMFYKYEHGLFIGFIVGLIFSQILIFKLIKVRCSDFEGIKKSEFVFMVKNSLISSVNIVGLNLPLIIIYNQLDAEIAGIYSLADKLIFAGIVICTNVFSRLIYNDLKEQAQAKVLKDWICKIVILATIIIIVSMFISEFAIETAFGVKWSLSANVFIALLPWMTIQLIMIPFTCALIYNGKEWYLLNVEILKNISRISVLMLCLYLNYDLVNIILASSIIPLVFGIAIISYGLYKNEIIN